jgi:hypothetical protein
MPHSLVFDHMFQLPLPILEKLLRPVIVYLVLVLLLRLFGKRELAQLNPFDLVVLLSLSNTVQNAIIGAPPCWFTTGKSTARRWSASRSPARSCWR